MKLNTTNYEAKSLGEFLGISKERLKEIAILAKSDVADYIISINVGQEIGVPENKLFESLINKCDNFEEALFITFFFQGYSRHNNWRFFSKNI